MSIKQNKIVISVGGSLVSSKKGLSTDFCKKLNAFVRRSLKKDHNLQFFIVVGGGVIAEEYRNFGRKVVGRKLATNDLDWLGIHSTRLNAHLIKTLFKDIAHPYIIKDYDIIRRIKEPVVVAAGWKPGFSTDYCAVTICEDYTVPTLINLTSTSYVFTKDPQKYPNAKPISKIDWRKYMEIIGDKGGKWIPSRHVPFDHIASKKSEIIGLKVIVLKGDDFGNIENCLEGKDFIGTVIEH